MLLALNMCDEAKKEGIELDTSVLRQEFQSQVVEISAKTKKFRTFATKNYYFI